MKKKSGALVGIPKSPGLRYLTEKNAARNPFDMFKQWFNEAFDQYEEEANAMMLSTVGDNNQPSSRMVLLKEFSDKGFVFFTNYLSRKGLEIAINPFVSLLFYWPLPERQIRIEGFSEKINPGESDKYFASRPKESRISAVISPQSQIVPDRNFLEKKFDEVEKSSPGEIPRPHHWGGYRVHPASFEFWQGRQGRLHDRLLYKPEGAHWIISRLAP